MSLYHLNYKGNELDTNLVNFHYESQKLSKKTISTDDLMRSQVNNVHSILKLFYCYNRIFHFVNINQHFTMNFIILFFLYSQTRRKKLQLNNP